jgi:SAM-dependent methyltransferase
MARYSPIKHAITWNRILIIILELTSVLFSLVTPTAAEIPQYQPTVGQDGKDVVWGPTPERLVEAMLDLAQVSPDDYVIDLGSGDGRIAIAAAKRGAHSLGIEYNTDLVEISKQYAHKENVSDRADFLCADIFESDFSNATVLTMYLFTKLNLKLRPKILEMKPGTRVVSHAFTMENWKADQIVTAGGRTAYLWIVPAKVAGTWVWPTESSLAELTIRQTYQKISGSLKLNGKKQTLKRASLEGDRISFVVGKRQPTQWEYSGRISGDAIEGVAKTANGTEVKWEAKRLPPR